jgi:hypothetical protein
MRREDVCYVSALLHIASLPASRLTVSHSAPVQDRVLDERGIIALRTERVLVNNGPANPILIFAFLLMAISIID